MSRHLKLAAAVLAVLLTISGFAPAGSKGSSRSRTKSSHGGGGCSSSHSTSHNYGHYDDDDDDDDYGTSGGSGTSTSGGADSTPSPKSSQQPRAEVISCASESEPYSHVRLESSAGFTKGWTVSVRFLDTSGDTVGTGSTTVEVGPHDWATATVELPDPSKADQVATCRILDVKPR